LNILFDIGHPAHVHLFKNFISYLKKGNHDITVTSRNKDVTTDLLDNYGIKHFILSTPGIGFLGFFNELLIRNKQLFLLNRKKKFSLSFGTSVSIAHLTALTGIESFNFHEDDDSVVPVQSLLIYPFTSKIINPDCIKILGWRKKRVFYPSYHELAYLHPNNYTPNPEIPELYGLIKKNYIIIRLSSLSAHHDRNKKGISFNLYNKIKEVIKNYTLVDSVESSKSHSIKPRHLHDIINYAKMIISDSQTMTAEAAVLGIPSVRYNSFVGRISYLEELEHKYKLTYGFRPGNDDKMIDKINELLNRNNLNEEWQKRRLIMLSDKVDFNEWMIKYFKTLLHHLAIV
jgi:hypothetical protein|tara:strand:+ start:3338 stop:4369 length:1032 start_codon:yes stop_codon:yes gene_type:complete